MHFHDEQILGKIVNNLLKDKNEEGWNATSPIGAEGDSLMQVMHRFAQVISRSLIFHVVDMRAVVSQARVGEFFDNVGKWRESGGGRGGGGGEKETDRQR